MRLGAYAHLLYARLMLVAGDGFEPPLPVGYEPQVFPDTTRDSLLAIIPTTVSSFSDRLRKLANSETELDDVVEEFCHDVGGPDRTRTRHLLRAKQPLSQMSYWPNDWSEI